MGEDWARHEVIRAAKQGISGARSARIEGNHVPMDGEGVGLRSSQNPPFHASKHMTVGLLYRPHALRWLQQE